MCPAAHTHWSAGASRTQVAALTSTSRRPCLASTVCTTSLTCASLVTSQGRVVQEGNSSSSAFSAVSRGEGRAQATTPTAARAMHLATAPPTAPVPPMTSATAPAHRACTAAIRPIVASSSTEEVAGAVPSTESPRGEGGSSPAAAPPPSGVEHGSRPAYGGCLVVAGEASAPSVPAPALAVASAPDSGAWTAGPSWPRCAPLVPAAPWGCTVSASQVPAWWKSPSPPRSATTGPCPRLDRCAGSAERTGANVGAKAGISSSSAASSPSRPASAPDDRPSAALPAGARS